MIKNEVQKRQTCTIMNINDINSAQFMKENEWEPNYLKFGDMRVFRINLIGTVISKKTTNNTRIFTIDDGTGQIQVRIFEQNQNIDDFDVGESILIIGKPREFGSIYISPEIIKKIDDNKWISHRKLYLKLKENSLPKTESKFKIGVDNKGSIKSDTVSLKKVSAEETLNIIREMDSGPGVDIDELLLKIKNESIIDTLKKQGDIYEIKPGRVKILE